MVDGSRVAFHLSVRTRGPSVDVIVPMMLFPLIDPLYSRVNCLPLTLSSIVNPTRSPESIAPDRLIFRLPWAIVPLIAWYLCSISSA
jgi:hypothetical protein